MLEEETPHDQVVAFSDAAQSNSAPDAPAADESVSDSNQADVNQADVNQAEANAASVEESPAVPAATAEEKPADAGLDLDAIEAELEEIETSMNNLRSN